MRKTFIYKGKRYSVQRKTQRELEQAIRDKKRKIDEGIDTRKRITVERYTWDWFTTYKKPYVSQNTTYMYEANIKTLCSYIGKKQMSEITSSDIQQVVTSEFEKGRSKSKIDKVILTTRQVFKQAFADRIIDHNPAATIQKPTVAETTRCGLTDEDYNKVVEKAKDHEHGEWVLVMLYLGLRPSETALIKCGDITNTYVHVRGTKSKKADRYVPVPDALKFDLSGRKDEDYYFLNRRGKRLTRDDIRRMWDSFIEGTGVDATAYQLRHTYGTRAHKVGVPIDVLADIMGHENIETTRKYYIDDNKESKERQREKLNEMWK